MKQNLIGKKIWISGMTIEIIEVKNDQYECRNITTQQLLTMKKETVIRAIKLGKAEIIS